MITRVATTRRYFAWLVREETCVKEHLKNGLQCVRSSTESPRREDVEET